MIQIKKTSEKSIIPKKGSEYAAGYDISSIDEDTILQPSERKLFRTGLHVKIPEGYYGRIAPRSGLSLKQGVDVLAGVLDSDYIGEIGVILINLSNIPTTINTTKPIAQLIIEKYYDMTFELVDELTITQRGSGGFGSSDKPKINISETTVELPKIPGNIIKIERNSSVNKENNQTDIHIKERIESYGTIVDQYNKVGGIPVKKKYSDEIKERIKE